MRCAVTSMRLVRLTYTIQRNLDEDLREMDNELSHEDLENIDATPTDILSELRIF